jgi:hypothetical protein
MKLYKLFGGSNTTIVNNTQHLEKTKRPTIYIVSHKFSYFDILASFEIFSQCVPETELRTIAGVCDVPDWFRVLLVLLFNYVCTSLKLIAYNKRNGNTTQELANNLCLRNDVIIWQHPYNKSRGLYYILHKCIYEHNVVPRLVYIDICDRITTETLNNEPIWNIIRKTRNRTYYATSYEIKYSVAREITDNIYEEFTVPFWYQALLAKNNCNNDD